MSKMMKNLLAVICILGLAMMFGCVAIPDVVTPCYLPPGVNTFAHPQILPWDSLFDAKFVLAQLEFQKGLLQGSIQSSERFKQEVFSPSGPIGMLLPTSLTGILALMAGGKYIRSPREKELEKQVNNKV